MIFSMDEEKVLDKIQENSSLAYHAYFPFFVQTISQSLA